MIDVENLVVDKVTTGLSTDFPDVIVYSARSAVPAKFPAVVIYETNNSEVTELESADRIERYADIGYTVEVYTNDKTSRKSHAKQIFESVDDILRNIVSDDSVSNGFTRLGKSYVMSYNESELFGIVGNYIARVGEHPDGESISFYRR